MAGQVQAKASSTPYSETESAPKPPSFLSRLGNTLGGFVGIGNQSSPDFQRGAQIGNVIHRGSTAIELGAGNEAQKSAAIQEKQLEAEMPLRLAQYQSLNAYRTGKVATGEENAETARLKAQQQEKQNIANNRARGLVPDETTPGAYRAMTADEILQDPVLSQNQDLKQAAAMAHMQQAAYEKAQTDTILSGNTAQYAQQEEKIKNARDLAMATLGLKMHEMQRRDSNQANNNLKMTLDYGMNGQGQTLDQSNAAPGMYTDATRGGAPVPYKQQTAFMPTSPMRTQQQMAETIQPQIPKLQNEVDALASKLGPGAGRWNDFWVNKGGINDPDYAALNQDLTLFATALAKTHFPRGAQEIIQELKAQFGQAQDADNLKARIEHADSWVAGYANAVGRNVRLARLPPLTLLHLKKGDPLGIR